MKKSKFFLGLLAGISLCVFMGCNTTPTENENSEFYPKSLGQYKSGATANGKVVDFVYNSTVFNAERKAQVYLPPHYDESIDYPVIYLIHGIGCDSTQWVSMGASSFFDAFISKKMLNPFIAVFPSVIPANGLNPVTLSEENIQAFKDFVQELTVDLEPALDEKYSISTKREDTAICGLSMGGMEALRVGFTYLNKFDFIGSFSAAPTLETELLTTEGSDFVPELVLICSGDKDTTVGSNPYNYHMTLTNNGVPHLWYEHPNGTHSPEVWNLGLVNFLERLGGGFKE